jgi:hypothetical protein
MVWPQKLRLDAWNRKPICGATALGVCCLRDETSRARTALVWTLGLCQWLSHACTVVQGKYCCYRPCTFQRGEVTFHDPVQPAPLNRSTPKFARLMLYFLPPTLLKLMTNRWEGSRGQPGEKRYIWLSPLFSIFHFFFLFVLLSL